MEDTSWHFPWMIAAAVAVFLLVVRIVLPKEAFRQKKSTIALVTFVVVVLGMLIGKYGATWGLPWWIYYPIPLALTLLLPPLALKLNNKRVVLYLILSSLSAPFIHIAFSLLLGWNEYMPFWKL